MVSHLIVQKDIARLRRLVNTTVQCFAELATQLRVALYRIGYMRTLHQTKFKMASFIKADESAVVEVTLVDNRDVDLRATKWSGFMCINNGDTRLADEERKRKRKFKFYRRLVQDVDDRFRRYLYVYGSHMDSDGEG